MDPRLRRQMLMLQAPPMPVSKAKKTPLLLLNLFLGGVSADRMYLGLYTTAFIKLALLITGSVLGGVAGNKARNAYSLEWDENGFPKAVNIDPDAGQTEATIAGVLILIWTLWNIVDAAWIYYNIITDANRLPLGVEKVWADDQHDDHLSRTLAIVFAVIFVLSMIAPVALGINFLTMDKVQ